MHTTRVRRSLALVAALVLGLLGALHPQPAWAADDQVQSWRIAYTVNADGTVRATETLVYRFGSSGHHGIERSFVTREAYDDQHDAVYGVDVLDVSSPDASAQFSEQRSTDGRNAYLTVRIGSPNRTITSATATYTIDYVVTGAMRTFSDYDEFQWDALSGETPLTNNIDVTVQVPGGVKDVNCSTALPGQKKACTSSTVTGQQGHFTQLSKPAGEVMTVAAKIGSGLVADNAPHLQPRADQADLAMKRGGIGAGVLSLVLAPLAGLAYWRRRGRDLRFVGLPPGIVPGPGEQVAERPGGHVEVPVSFAPPKVSVAEAGLLVDGVIDTRETTATLVDLAVRGAVKLANDDSSTTVQLVDASVATQPHEMVLLQRLFGRGATPGDEVNLAGRGGLASAHEALVTSVRNQVAQRGWFTGMPSAAASGMGCSGIGLLVFGWFFFSGGSSSTAWLLLPLVPLVATVLVVRRALRRGQRTGVGRAVTDQVEGFRTYLATAEADQLRFEEGEDIFSRYLSWAILFGLADRWADVCAHLVQMGRLSAAPPIWYYGPYSNWNFYVFTSSLDHIGTAAMPQVSVPSSAGSSGSGFGGGSAFGGGGGFSGGGGGGGGVGSW